MSDEFKGVTLEEFYQSTTKRPEIDREGVADFERAILEIMDFVKKIEFKLITNKDKDLLADLAESIKNDESIEKLYNELARENGSDVSKENGFKEIIVQSFQKPENLIQALTKATEKIYDNKTDLTEITGILVGSINKEQYIINAKITLPPDLDGMLPKNLTPYDREVFNGVCSILATGQTSMTTRQIYEAMAGKSITTPQALGAVARSIRKMQTTLLSIDWAEHARMKGIDMEKDDFAITEEPIIPARGTYIKAFGQITSGYTLYAEPVLYTYAKAVGQISTTDKKVLQIPTLSNTEDNIVLKNYLIRHVEHIKNSKNWNPTLTFDTIFKDCVINVPANHTDRVRKVIFNILDYWKSIDYISAYEVNKQGRSYHSVTIKA